MKKCITPECRNEAELGLEHCYSCRRKVREMSTAPSSEGFAGLPTTPPVTAPPKCENPRCTKLVKRRGNPASGREWARYCSAYCNSQHSKQKSREKKGPPPSPVYKCEYEGCEVKVHRKGNLRYCEEHREASFKKKASQRTLAYLERKAAKELDMPDPPKAPSQEFDSTIKHTEFLPLGKSSDRFPGLIGGLEGLLAALQLMDCDEVRVPITIIKNGQFQLGAPSFLKTKESQ